MKEIIQTIFFDISSKSEERTGKYVLKSAYLINCLIICIWIAEKYGYSIIPKNLTYESIVELFSKYIIVIPVFLLLLIFLLVRVMTRAIGSILSSIIEYVLYLTFFEKKPLALFYIKKKAITKEVKRGENFNYYNDLIKEDKVNMEGHRLHAEYYCLAYLTMLYTYTNIVQLKFPNIYFSVFEFVLWSITIFWFLALGALYYFVRKMEETEKLFKNITE